MRAYLCSKQHEVGSFGRLHKILGPGEQVLGVGGVGSGEAGVGEAGGVGLGGGDPGGLEAVLP